MQIAKKTINDALPSLDKAATSTDIAQTDVYTYAGAIIQAALLVVGTSFLILAVYAGIMWMTAQGNDERIQRARNTLLFAIIGILIVVGGYAISRFFTEGLL